MNPDLTMLIAEDDDEHAMVIEKNLRRRGAGKTLPTFTGWAGNLRFFSEACPWRSRENLESLRAVTRY